MPAVAGALPEQQGFGVTRRRDGWWVVPAATFAVLSGFIVYSTWAAFQNAHYEFGNYLSPMYSPVLFGDSHHAWFGGKPSIWPAFLPWSPALLILWAPAGFRLTCYYYRGSYYKAFWASPMNCTVGKPWKTYCGENSLPLILQNVHRYFLYLAVGFIGILAWDAWKGMWFTDPATGAEQFGIGVGTLVLTTKVILLGGYTFGCHSFRHLAGGFLDRVSGKPARLCAYECSSWLNVRHMKFAWCSLFWVAFSDVYVRLAHVGDRTGLEMIRTLQDHGIHLGIDVHMEWTVTRLISDGGRVVGAFGYDREKGRFQLFRASAVVLATGGIGRAFRITSNSWEYTGDGHALAYEAGAELIDMEYVQFHPTGMVWPPSVRGILVTEGVRGEGGVLRNSEGRRFMFDDIPDLYKNSTASDPEEGWRYTQRDKEARRPPELLTRDHVARCIVREIREGRGSPHGGVFLDIAWIKAKLKNSEAHIQRKLPSMYHQFKELAGIDITREAMEVGPTTHYVMGGVKVDGETQMSGVPGLFAAGECAGGLHGANRLGGNSPSDLLVFGKRSGEHAAAFASANPRSGASEAEAEQVEAATRDALAPLERQGGGGGVGSYAIQSELQDLMQTKVGIVRNQAELESGLEAVLALRERAKNVSVSGNRAYNPGWHTALDLPNLLLVSEAVARAAALRKESRGAHFREDHTGKDEHWGSTTLVVRKGADGGMEIVEEPVTPPREELQQIIGENR